MSKWLIVRRRLKGVSPGKERWAVVIVDMQPGFLKNKEESIRKALIKAQVEVIKYCAALDIPVVCVEYSGKECTIKQIEEWLLVVPRLVRVTKNCMSAFYKTGLAKKLRDLGADSLLLMGVNAHACIKETAWDAIWRGFKFATAECLITDETPGALKGALKWFRRRKALIPEYLDMLLASI